MKTRFRSILAIIILLLSITNAQADKEKYSRKITKKFNVNKDAVLHVENKFGKVHCSNWNNNEIAFEVVIEVEAAKKEKADKVLNSIQINFSNSSNKVSAITEFKKDDLNNVGEIRIDYTINVPTTVSLNLENKFGDVFVEETSAPASFDIGYGKLEANKLSNPDTEIEVKFGSALIDEMKSGNIEVQYAESFEIGKAEDLSIESKFSQLEISGANNISIESAYDGIWFGKITSLDCESDFSEFEIDFIAEKVILSLDYGDFVVDNFGLDFQLIEIENSFGKVKLNIPDQASFNLNAETRFGSLTYPKKNANVSHEKDGYSRNIYKGTIGKNNNPKAQVVITSKNGNVIISN